MPTFYRIAKRSSIEYGMYRGSDCTASWDMCEETRHPTPFLDYKLKDAKWTYDFIFGFCSKEQAQNWIYREEWQNDLAAHGFVVYEITLLPSAVEGEQYFIGATQGIWNKYCMQTIRVQDIEEFFA